MVNLGKDWGTLVKNQPQLGQALEILVLQNSISVLFAQIIFSIMSQQSNLEMGIDRQAGYIVGKQRLL